MNASHPRRSGTALLQDAIGVLSRLLADADGAAPVTIPAAEHRRLVDLARRAMKPQRHRGLSRFDRDPELAAFIAARAGRMFMREIVADCRRAFGPERTPSLSAVHRFLQRRDAEHRP